MPEVCGIRVDAQTRCIYYDSPLDVIAIKAKFLSQVLRL